MKLFLLLIGLFWMNCIAYCGKTERHRIEKEQEQSSFQILPINLFIQF
jgi:hypothetical protein